MAGWRGTYRHKPSDGRMTVHSAAGQRDIVAELRNGRRFRAECKKGSLSPSKSSKEYPLLREALGQLLTMEAVGPSDILAVSKTTAWRFRRARRTETLGRASKWDKATAGRCPLQTIQ
jgi:hypothetical protein